MFWKGKVLLVTGGTGSFGSVFVREILRHDPAAVRIFSRDELKQSELQGRLADDRVRYFIGDVRDRDRVSRALDGVNVVIHAAALKQVPACEYNPLEAVKTNIGGAANLIECAIDRGVERLVALSTDKAVNPVNLYGATKLCAEKLFVQGNSYAAAHRTRFSCVRYGNVLGSRGSVVPLFQQQARSGVITLTDPRMTRFWLTLEQGVRFVIRCTEMMHGGEVFVPKIPSMKLTDLAEAIAPQCERRTIGARPGEKIHEVLITEDEAAHSRDIGDSYVIEPQHPWWKHESWDEGKRLPDGFRYASDLNDRWLSRADLEALLAAKPGEPRG